MECEPPINIFLPWRDHLEEGVHLHWVRTMIPDKYTLNIHPETLEKKPNTHVDIYDLSEPRSAKEIGGDKLQY